MDNYQQEEGINNSAAEFIFTNTDGSHTIVTDEAMGLGFATVAPYDGVLCADPFGGELAASSLTLSLSIILAMFAFY